MPRPGTLQHKIVAFKKKKRFHRWKNAKGNGLPVGLEFVLKRGANIWAASLARDPVAS